jgi:glycosyltransferase involved in cell wall biosynthesis
LKRQDSLSEVPVAAKTIGLCMIARNEAHCIKRCLVSVMPLIDFALVVDTGSSDGTQDVIRSFLEENSLPGVVIDEPWRDFAWNRTHALAELRKHENIDYGLMIDADEALEISADFDVNKFKKSLCDEFYYIESLHDGIINLRPQMFKNKTPFVFRGVLHEFLQSPDDNCSRGTVRGFRSRSYADSARNKNPRKYLHDVKTLEAALETESEPFMVARYTFYLAQSYRDAGDSVKALRAYLERAEQGFWEQEVFVSLYWAGRLMEALGYSDTEILGSYLKAFEICPSRAEALHAATRYCRLNNKPHLGYMIGRWGIEIKAPEGALFLEPWIYDYGMLDEFSVVAYWAGHYSDSLDASRKLLKLRNLPESYSERIQQNAQFASEKLRETRSK